MLKREREVAEAGASETPEISRHKGRVERVEAVVVYRRGEEACVEMLGSAFDDRGQNPLHADHRPPWPSPVAPAARAYGWPASAARDPADSNGRLLALNQEIARGARPYEPFAG